jgi:hypothetical protein
MELEAWGYSASTSQGAAIDIQLFTTGAWSQLRTCDMVCFVPQIRTLPSELKGVPRGSPGIRRHPIGRALAGRLQRPFHLVGWDGGEFREPRRCALFPVAQMTLLQW